MNMDPLNYRAGHGATLLNSIAESYQWLCQYNNFQNVQYFTSKLEKILMNADFSKSFLKIVFAVSAVCKNWARWTNMENGTQYFMSSCFCIANSKIWKKLHVRKKWEMESENCPQIQVNFFTKHKAWVFLICVTACNINRMKLNIL